MVPSTWEPASVRPGVVKLTVQVLFPQNAVFTVQRAPIFSVELLDGHPTSALAGFKGRGLHDSSPFEIIVFIVPLGQGDVIPRLQAACPVVNLLEGNDRVWIDRVRVRGSLLEKKTTGKGQKR